MMKKLLVVLLSGLFMWGCANGPTPIVPNGSRLLALPILNPTRTVGTGTGDLLIDGQTLGILPGDVVAITPGTYSSITVLNLNGTVLLPVMLVANDLVEVVGGGVSLQNVSYLTVDGGATTKNLFLHDIAYRGITISGGIPHSLTLQGIRARNIADYAIFYADKTNYTGSDATAFTDFDLLYCDFENTGAVHFDGGLSQSAGLINNGLMKNPEVGYCSFTNSATAGTLLYFGNADGMNIHHNRVDNVNTENNNHNGIFFLKGSGSAHHNKCTNHQGNFIRFWPYSQGISPDDVLLYDNIVWNSRKYSAMELQSFADNMIPGVSTYCNAKVYNNTVGRMNTALPTVFVGVVVDVYNLYGGDLQIINNLSFDEVKTTANDGIWSEQSVTKPSVYSNNLTFSTASDAGLVDQSSFRLVAASPAKRAGAYRLYQNDDYYGTKRSLTPSVGAVE